MCHFNIGRVQSVSVPDFAKIVGLSLATFRDDEDAFIAGASRQFAFELLTLAFFRAG